MMARKASTPCSRRIRLASGDFNKAAANDLENDRDAARLEPRSELACVLAARVVVVADHGDAFAVCQRRLSDRWHPASPSGGSCAKPSRNMDRKRVFNAFRDREPEPVIQRGDNNGRAESAAPHCYLVEPRAAVWLEPHR
jgi:hypothetical protein